MIEVFCPTADDTRAAGRKLAAAIRPGDVIELAGGLGAGKTLLTGGLCEGLGVEELVVSPSFVLVRQYDSGFIPVVHVDVYRLGSLHEFEDLDVFELAADGVLVIEWGDAVESALPEDHLRIEFDVNPDETRLLRLIPSGDWADRDLETVT
ncbi:MAG TPA: tRNA (adenosine(37)-N6)-threonylcarbamoyltransferase complex ATPase subunit type 1 TsaE [Acidimicrobiia bacterium]|nr:tRNA (adenosine(37)-N6)-threonylcarbamoyltransferase complex ATPase subunit type 1 TsaE [Acidimicrobiia bacterium]